VLDRTKEPGRSASRCSSTSPRPWARRRPRRAGRHAAGHRRPVRAVEQGVHAGHGGGGVRRAGRDGDSAPRPRFTVGITDDVTHLSLPVRPDLDIMPGTVRRRVLRSRLRRHRRARTRTPSRSSAPRRAPSPRATSSTTPRSRARGRSATCASARRRSGAVPRLPRRLHRLPPLVDPGAGGRAGVRRRAARCSSTRPSRPKPSGTTCPSRLQRGIIDKGLELYAIDAKPSPARPAWAGRTNTVLQTCFFAISEVLPATRRSRRSRPRSARRTASGARRSSPRTRRPWTPRWRTCTGSRCRRR
jgi:hypothetical protein